MYAIRALCPRTDIQTGHHGFSIDLSPEWPALVAASGITDNKVAVHIQNLGDTWLAACGWTSWFDPDNCGHTADTTKPPGPNAYRSPNWREIRLRWGLWGIEHLSVPGNACGLDIDHSAWCLFRGGVSLVPHNIDSWAQKQLLLIVFTEIAESILLFSRKSYEADFAAAK